VQKNEGNTQEDKKEIMKKTCGSPPCLSVHVTYSILFTLTFQLKNSYSYIYASETRTRPDRQPASRPAGQSASQTSY